MQRCVVTWHFLHKDNFFFFCSSGALCDSPGRALILILSLPARRAPPLADRAWCETDWGRGEALERAGWWVYLRVCVCVALSVSVCVIGVCGCCNWVLCGWRKYGCRHLCVSSDRVPTFSLESWRWLSTKSVFVFLSLALMLSPLRLNQYGRGLLPADTRSLSVCLPHSLFLQFFLLRFSLWLCLSASHPALFCSIAVFVLIHNPDPRVLTLGPVQWCRRNFN